VGGKKEGQKGPCPQALRPGRVEEGEAVREVEEKKVSSTGFGTRVNLTASPEKEANTWTFLTEREVLSLCQEHQSISF